MKNFDIAWYYDELNAVRQKQAEAKKDEKVIVSQIRERYNDDFKNILKTKKEPYGKVSTQEDGFEIICTTQKKVTWNQEILAELYKRISEHEDASQYISVEYKVSETAYKNWPNDIKEAFKKARTEQEGTVKIEIEQH
jgi:hypothetical protein